MSIKKIIAILLIILAILGILFYLLLSDRQQNSGSTAPTDLPTGIIQPTTAIAQGELDVIGVRPDDSSDNVPVDSTIEISFSRQFSSDEIEFFISPKTSFFSDISDNKLVVSPQTSWETGTLYTYSIVFPDDDQKVRLYRFTTEGPEQEFLPDTRPDELIQEEEQYEKQEATDIYVTNNTPYENDTFAIQSAFEQTEPAHFYFTVTPKIEDEQMVRNAVNVWLQTLDLTQSQINSLDIRYEQ